ncbi:hypothetical protein ANN_17617 [Periplaneta americana]|uniref:Reverse transcriptase domain-containing protein n=1 Tax=Periplaneta americana TaxID=6978 RepID=A0ABQ8STE8_PERAM|nr:hypothetical protein ANN_17617 [Periplaneta americana]
MWRALMIFRLPAKVINLIKNMYATYTCYVEHQRELSEPIEVKTGVEQECPLSLILFLKAQDLVMTGAMNRRRGLQWGLIKRLEDLDFEDDLYLLAHSYKDMEMKLGDLDVEAANIGLKVNAKKTKEMRFRNLNTSEPRLDDQHIEQVNKFCYFGSVITTKEGRLMISKVEYIKPKESSRCCVRYGGLKS